MNWIILLWIFIFVCLFFWVIASVPRNTEWKWQEILQEGKSRVPVVSFFCFINLFFILPFISALIVQPSKLLNLSEDYSDLCGFFGIACLMMGIGNQRISNALIGNVRNNEIKISLTILSYGVNIIFISGSTLLMLREIFREPIIFFYSAR